MGVIGLIMLLVRSTAITLHICMLRVMLLWLSKALYRHYIGNKQHYFVISNYMYIGLLNGRSGPIISFMKYYESFVSFSTNLII